MAEALARALEPRACLLIVDDLWVADHLRAFTVAGPRCRLLITTRHGALVRHFGARIHPIGVMAADEALRLLETWADGHLDETDGDIKQAILDRLGGLPLAIKLAGAQLQGAPAAEWLTSFAGALALDAGFGATDRESSVAACFRLSVEAMDDRSRRLYSALGIFREDESIPIAAVAKLWSEWVGVTPSDVQRLCSALADHALVELVHDREALQLHDLIRQMTVELLGNQRVETHRRIVAAYARTRSGASWVTAADDGYLYDHVAYHLASALDADGLRGLFDDDQWMWARLRSSEHQLDGYLEDLVKLPDTGGLGARGAESGHYSDREHYLMQVASRLSAAQVLRCLSARGRTRDELPFVRWVVRFAPLMPAHAHAIDAALRVVLRMPEEWEMTPATRERAFAALAPRLSANQLATCLEVIESGGICLTQILGLVTLLPHLRDEARRQALDSVRSKIASTTAAEDWTHSVALAALISSVPEGERPLMAQEVLAHLRLGFAGHDEALAAVIPFLPPAALNRLLRQMAEPSHERVLGLLPDVVRTLVPHLSERAIRELDEELGEPARRHGLRGQAHCLARLHLIEHLPTSRREAIVAAALEELRDAESYSYGDDMQERILDRIPADSTGRAMDIAYAYADSELRIGALRVLIPKLDEARREKAIDVFLRDVFAVEGLYAIMLLGSAVRIIVSSSDRRRLLRREFVDRLRTDRGIPRVALLEALEASQLLSEALFPKSVLSAFATKLIALYCDWTWP